jgi:hypothetical protein
MTPMTTIVLTGSLLVAGAGAPAAQVKTIPGELITASATIEAIDHAKRMLTIKEEDGAFDTIKAPPEVTRFSELKVGDKITVRYYTSMIVRLKKPGEAAIDVEGGAITSASGPRQAGTVATQQTITATVAAIDHKTPSITLTGPHGWKDSRKVDDKKALAQLKVGDRLDVTWNEAVLIAVSPAK